MKVKIKKLHPDAVIPKYAKDGDAGLDLVAISHKSTESGMCMEYRTGLAVAIPKGYVGLLFNRSSVSEKVQSLVNAVGVIDSGYRGEIKLRFKHDTLLFDAYSKEHAEPNDYLKVFYDDGDKVGQLIIIPYPTIEFEEVSELDSTERGEGGFGSTDEDNINKLSRERMIQFITNIDPFVARIYGYEALIKESAWNIDMLSSLEDISLHEMYKSLNVCI